MDITSRDLESKAEEIEALAKEEMRKKNYLEAVLLFEEARDHYTKLNWDGKVGMLNKTIDNVKNILEMEKSTKTLEKQEDSKKIAEQRANTLIKKAENLEFQKKFDEALNLYEEAYFIYDDLGFDFQMKRIIWKMNQIREKVDQLENEVESIKNGLTESGERELTIGEKRDLRLKQQREESQRKEEFLRTERIAGIEERKLKLLVEQEERVKKHKELEEQRQNLIKEAQKKAHQENLIKQQEEIRIREEKLKVKIEAKKKNDMQIIKAEKFMEDGKKALDNKEYDIAKEIYLKAREHFVELNWVKQVKTLNEEITNIDRWKKENELEQESERLRKELRDQEYQERLRKQLEEMEQKKQMEFAKEKEIPEQVKTVLSKIEMIIDKARLDESKGNLKRCIDRYRLVKDLYDGLRGIEQLDAKAKIEETKIKIEDLSNKMNSSQ